MENLEQLAREYLADTRARGLSAHTTKTYGESLKLFLTFCRERQVSTVESLDLRLLGAYRNDLMDRYTPGGAHTRLRSLRAFCRYLEDQEIVTANPFRRFRMPRVPQEQQAVVTVEDFEALARAAALTEKPLRDQAIIALFFDTGLRVSELCGVRHEDILASEGGVMVRGKGGKDRIVPVSRPVLRRIQRYVRDERPASPLRQVFLTGPEKAIDRGAVKQMLERVFARVGLKAKGCHAFRRGFAVTFIRNGGNVLVLQRILGHTTLTMSSRYAQMDFDVIKEAHLMASPVTGRRPR